MMSDEAQIVPRATLGGRRKAKVLKMTKKPENRPWVVQGAIGRYDLTVKENTRRLAREPNSSMVERKKNALELARSGRALAREYFGGKFSADE